MSFLVGLFGNRQLDRIEATLAQLELTLKQIGARMSTQETALNAALAAVAQNVADVRTGVDSIIAKLNERTDVDLSDETAALEGLATDLQAAEDKLAAATAESEAPPEG